MQVVILKIRQCITVSYSILALYPNCDNYLAMNVLGRFCRELFYRGMLDAPTVRVAALLLFLLVPSLSNSSVFCVFEKRLCCFYYAFCKIDLWQR